MEQKLVRKPAYCAYYNGPCVKDKCPAFASVRPMTIYEHQSMAAADIPVTDPYVHNWCLKFDRHVVDIMSIVEIEESA